MITKTLSVDLKPHGIITVAIHPGWVQTKMPGPHAPMSTTTSVIEMLNTISSLNAETSGTFLNYDGAVIPW